MCIIELKGMEFHSFIGHYDEEKQIGNNFKVELRMKTDCQRAGESDNLNDALDYQLAYNIVKKEMQHKCNLLENVAKRIVDALLQGLDMLEEVEVKVTKLYPKLGGIVDEVSVIMEGKRK